MKMTTIGPKQVDSHMGNPNTIEECKVLSLMHLRYKLTNMSQRKEKEMDVSEKLRR